MKDLEVEIKFPLKNPDKIIRFLDKSGESKGEDHQKDTYFVPLTRDFLSKRPVAEWLRIREGKGKPNMNYKNWDREKHKSWSACDEYEVMFDDADMMKKIFAGLGFSEIVVVEKKRRNWHFKGTIISIDQVERLGSFIEIESNMHFDTAKEAEIYLHKILLEIDAEVGEQDFKGYPYLLLEKKGLI